VFGGPSGKRFTSPPSCPPSPAAADCPPPRRRSAAGRPGWPPPAHPVVDDEAAELALLDALDQILVGPAARQLADDRLAHQLLDGQRLLGFAAPSTAALEQQEAADEDDQRDDADAGRLAPANGRGQVAVLAALAPQGGLAGVEGVVADRRAGRASAAARSPSYGRGRGRGAATRQPQAAALARLALAPRRSPVSKGRRPDTRRGARIAGRVLARPGLAYSSDSEPPAAGYSVDEGRSP
jgi:hypothetical protein